MALFSDDFAKELQKECLQEIISEIDPILTIINDLHSNPEESLNIINQKLHSFKGNSQATSIKYISIFFHKIESLLFEFHSAIHSLREKPEHLDTLEFYLSETTAVIERYTEELLDGTEDNEELLVRKLQSLYHFRGWVEEITGVNISFELSEESPLEKFTFEESR